VGGGLLVRVDVVRETPEEVERLQALMDDSIERAGAFIRASLEMPEHSLSAAQMLRHWQGFPTAAVATTTARGEPRVAPVGVACYRGHFVVPTVAESARARAIRARPAISITRFDGQDFAVIVHGHATVIREDDPLFAELARIQKDLTNQDIRTWSGEGVYLWVTPESLYTYARHPERFGE
jgi:hypothetical protein